MRRRQAITTLALSSAAIAFPAIARSADLPKVRFCGVPTDDLACVYWGIKEGLYRKAGLDLEFVPTASGTAATTAVITGAYDIGKGSTIAAFIAHLKGVPIVLIGNGVLWETDNPWSLGIVAADSPIKTAPELNGNVVSAAALNDLSSLAINVWMDKNGGDSKTLKWVEIPNSAAAAAVIAHRTAACQLNEPQLSAAVKGGKCRILAPFLGAIGSSYVLTAYFTRTEWAKQHPDLDKEFQHILNGTLPDGWDKDIPTFPADAKGLATRKSDQQVLNAVAKNVPWLLGGSADLHPSTFTLIDGEADFEPNSYGGRNFHFGIREHTMGSILNGMTLSGLRAYGSTFLIFSDYMRPPIRLAALMDIPCIFIYTHDSIGLGEDGPTHQPIEQLMSLRAIPRLLTFRPADANEVAETWRTIMPIMHQPVLMAFTRQGVPTFARKKDASAAGVAKGAYIMADADGGKPELILMGTGSEVQLCVEAYEKLTAEGVKARVVSMPCWELFEKQSAEYKLQVLPPDVRARVAVEAGTSLGWKEYVGSDGIVVARADFGASAPIKDLLKHFGFTVDNVVAKAKEVLAKVKG